MLQNGLDTVYQITHSVLYVHVQDNLIGEIQPGRWSTTSWRELTYGGA